MAEWVNVELVMQMKKERHLWNHDWSPSAPDIRVHLRWPGSHFLVAIHSETSVHFAFFIWLHSIIRLSCLFVFSFSFFSLSLAQNYVVWHCRLSSSRYLLRFFLSFVQQDIFYPIGFFVFACFRLFLCGYALPPEMIGEVYDCMY